MKIAFAHQHDAGRKWGNNSADNFRPRLLKGLSKNADAEVKRGSPGETDLKAIVWEIDIVWRVALPHGKNDVDCLCENLVAILVQNPDRFAVGRGYEGVGRLPLAWKYSRIGECDR